MNRNSGFGMLQDAHFDTFCHLLVEDYLRKKNMQETLYHFRDEWGTSRPNEDDIIMSWYEVAMKLRMPEIIQAGSESMSVMENLTLALVTESSLRARRGVEVTVQGLCDMPKMKPLPGIPYGQSGQQAITNGPLVGETKERAMSRDRTYSYESFDKAQNGSVFPDGASVGDDHSAQGSAVSANHSKASLHLKKQPTAAVLAALQQKKDKQEAKAKLAAETNAKAKAVSRAGQRVVLSVEAEAIIKQEVEKQEELMNKLNARKIKPSSENWIPDLERSRSLERDFNVLKANLSDIQKREMQEKREMKQFLVSDLEKARNAESLGQMHRHACGCCLQKYLPLNLPLRVSQKAVLDIRIKWGGNLNSKTVFGGVNPPIGKYLAGSEVDSTGKILNPEGTFASGSLEDFMAISKASDIAAEKDRDPTKKSYLEKIQDRLSRMPRCYSDVPICTFCAQFFQNQSEYRPSYETITYQERKSKYMSRVAKEREQWDPLKLVEKDREAAIAEEEARNLQASQQTKEVPGVSPTGGPAEETTGGQDEFMSP